MPLRDYLDDLLPPSPTRVPQGLPRSPGLPKSLNFISILSGLQVFNDNPSVTNMVGSVNMYPVPIHAGARVRMIIGSVSPFFGRSSYTFPCFFQWGGTGGALGMYIHNLPPLRVVPTHNLGVGVVSVSAAVDIAFPDISGGLYFGVVLPSDNPSFNTLFVGVE